MPDSHPYSRLTPDVVLNALDAVGLRCDGRLLALNSYENRVYQVGTEAHDGAQGLVVAKFYRPDRWSDAQILEEHAFAAELVEREVPVVAPLAHARRTLHACAASEGAHPATPKQRADRDQRRAASESKTAQSTR